MVSHFLSALDRLADPALLQFVKHLQSRAQGEVRANDCCGPKLSRLDPAVFLALINQQNIFIVILNPLPDDHSIRLEIQTSVLIQTSQHTPRTTKRMEFLLQTVVAG